MSDTLERDPGFCSGGEGEDDDIEAEDGIHSPTDASEDSVDVKVQAISLRNKNKRKSAEPRRLDTDLPAKKRKIDLLTVKSEKEESRNSSPFRPWSASPISQFSREDILKYSQNGVISKSDSGARYPNSGIEHNLTCRLPSLQPSPLKIYPQDLSKIARVPNGDFSDAQDEPLSLVSKKKLGESDLCGKSHSGSVLRTEKERDDELPWHTPFALNPPKNKDRYSVINRIRNCKTFGCKRARSTGEGKSKTDEDSSRCGDNKFRIDSLLSSTKTDGKSNNCSGTKASQGGQQRNYKNMTRERRIEANARERTRVHTISAAFDTLRHSIPAYSHNQKLSKLSVLRIACSYIMTLSRLAGYDYSKDQSEPDISNCVENVSKTIQTEGKIRKKKDE